MMIVIKDEAVEGVVAGIHRREDIEMTEIDSGATSMSMMDQEVEGMTTGVRKTEEGMKINGLMRDRIEVMMSIAGIDKMSGIEARDAMIHRGIGGEMIATPTSPKCHQEGTTPATDPEMTGAMIVLATGGDLTIGAMIVLVTGGDLITGAMIVLATGRGLITGAMIVLVTEGDLIPDEMIPQVTDPEMTDAMIVLVTGEDLIIGAMIVLVTGRGLIPDEMIPQVTDPEMTGAMIVLVTEGDLITDEEKAQVTEGEMITDIVRGVLAQRLGEWILTVEGIRQVHQDVCIGRATTITMTSRLTRGEMTIARTIIDEAAVPMIEGEGTIHEETPKKKDPEHSHQAIDGERHCIAMINRATLPGGHRNAMMGRGAARGAIFGGGMKKDMMVETATREEASGVMTPGLGNFNGRTSIPLIHKVFE